MKKWTGLGLVVAGLCLAGILGGAAWSKRSDQKANLERLKADSDELLAAAQTAATDDDKLRIARRLEGNAETARYMTKDIDDKTNGVLIFGGGGLLFAIVGAGIAWSGRNG